MKKVLAVLLWSPALYNLARERRDTESKKAQLAKLKRQYKKAQAEYIDLSRRTTSAYRKASDLNNKIRTFECKDGF
jgi:molecular chaperone GrpE (heat shock protein)